MIVRNSRRPCRKQPEKGTWVPGAVVTVPKRPSPRPTRAVVRRPPRVLVIDDEGRIRDASVDALRKRGLVVRGIARFDALPTAIRRFGPDVVVLSDVMRGSEYTSAEVLPRLIERHPGVRYVVTTMRIPEEMPSHLDPLRRGASEVLHRRLMFRDHALVRCVMSVVRD